MMPVKLRRQKHRRGIPYRECEYDLLLGPDVRNPMFGGPDTPARREAWEMHKDRIMACWFGRGRRPHAFWWFECPAEKIPEDVCCEHDALVRLGLADPEERALIEDIWARRRQAALERYPNDKDAVIDQVLDDCVPSWWISKKLGAQSAD
jgi:hypothetical protein